MYGDIMFSMMPIFMMIIFVIVFVGIITTFMKKLKEKQYNDSQPRINAKVKVVGKRTSVNSSAGHSDCNGAYHNGTTSTWYYVTFQFESGDRGEFTVDGREYGLMAEGDVGTLLFQGRRFLEFNRDV